MKLDRTNLLAATSATHVQIEVIAAELAALRSRPLSNRHRAAAAALAEAQAARDAARQRQRDLIAQRLAAQPGQGADRASEIADASAQLEAAAEQVRHARLDRDAAVTACASGIIAGIAPT